MMEIGKWHKVERYDSGETLRRAAALLANPPMIVEPDGSVRPLDVKPGAITYVTSNTEIWVGTDNGILSYV